MVKTKITVLATDSKEYVISAEEIIIPFAVKHIEDMFQDGNTTISIIGANAALILAKEFVQAILIEDGI